MLRISFGAILIGTVLAIGLAGYQGATMTHTPVEWFNDMAHQPKFNPQHRSNFFADGRAGRLPVPGTIPMGYTVPKGLDGQQAHSQVTANNLASEGSFATLPNYFNTGREGDVYGDGIPPQLIAQGEKFIRRGQERYNIYCLPCHGAAGTGDGVVKNFGMVTVRSVVDDLTKAQPDGQIFNTITHGKNTMGAYGPNISVEDRWAIVSYVRALQRAQRGTVAELPQK